ncbi:hypothetical protein DYB28_004583 [Aphanomyces astaci]|uniref:Uncharacterized protein n=1 Tax=Aphanomyces astaci TaxID=112090 RepID=A0A397BKA9_APHAT|nr:hypothetical protein DYB36_002423 [Aphanomyces astaci]RHY21448.1 hypothetical protein DYB25_006237 [Aphanomyces astaci]RHY70254.1 hypothetical protein DYB30_006944 [Aphanomyces astaci]RHY71341.1 hypothetical protein DYB38_008695 [Aphanomyces astaci]RLO12771.1 hypothetical protein DYB28_004583 [Aphanomyces astaci]
MKSDTAFVQRHFFVGVKWEGGYAHKGMFGVFGEDRQLKEPGESRGSWEGREHRGLTSRLREPGECGVTWEGWETSGTGVARERGEVGSSSPRVESR